MRTRWTIVGAFGVLTQLVVAAFLYQSIGLAPWRWGIPAGTCWLYIWIFARSRLGEHRPPDGGPAFTRLGPGMLLSSARAWCLAALTGFLFSSNLEGFFAWLPALFYMAAAIADYFDGYLARRSATASGLGVALDLELDALGLLVAVSLAVSSGKLHWAFLPIGLARYGFAFLEWVRRRSGRPVHPLPPSLSRRPIAGWTMGYVCAALWPILDRPELTIAGVLFLLPFLGSFLRDGAAVSGLLDPESSGYQRIRSQARRVLLTWLPVGLRLGLAYFALVEGGRLLWASGRIAQGFGQLGLGPPALLAQIFGVLLVVLALAAVVGAAGRFVSFALLFPIALTIAAAGLDNVRALGLTVTIGLLMLGTGAGSVWSPSDIVFRRRPGEVGI